MQQKSVTKKNVKKSNVSNFLTDIIHNVVKSEIVKYLEHPKKK